MSYGAFAGLLLIIANVIVSYKGFKDAFFFQKYCFHVEKVLVNKDYKRLITSGFLHGDWQHLIFNMYSLYIFSGALEMYVGSLAFILIYFISLIGGNLLSLYIHRNHSNYQAIGASGAVSGVIFACIALFPGFEIGFFPFPIYIWGWLYGLGYLLYSMYGIGNKRGNIGHDAHLGGALVGIITALIIRPVEIAENWFAVLVMTIPCFIFLYLIVTRPHLLLKQNMFSKRNSSQKLTIDQRYNGEKVMEQKDIDAILEKIHRRGIDSLSRVEKEKLEKYSKH